MRSGSFAYCKEFLSDFYFELSKKYGIDLTFKIFLSAGRGLGTGFFLFACFFFWFCHGWSLLSAHRHRKRTVDFLGCPDGSIKFSWGYPLKELRSSAPLFISSWIMVAKSFFTLSLSVFAPAFSTYTVLSPNLKVA